MRHRIWLRSGLAMLALIVALIAPVVALAGGFTVTLDKTPTDIEAGKPLTISFLIRSSHEDRSLQGGLARGALHEVFAEGGRHGAAATGFIAGLTARVTARRPLVWVRQDFCELEAGSLSMHGLADLGLDPRCVVTVRAPDVESALRTTADALACDALGAVVLEVWGEAGRFDLVASRKLTLTAQASGVTALLLRLAAQPAVQAVSQDQVGIAAPNLTCCSIAASGISLTKSARQYHCWPAG